jgi:hypothetical protein
MAKVFALSSWENNIKEEEGESTGWRIRNYRNRRDSRKAYLFFSSMIDRKDEPKMLPDFAFIDFG